MALFISNSPEETFELGRQWAAEGVMSPDPRLEKRYIRRCSKMFCVQCAAYYLDSICIMFGLDRCHWVPTMRRTMEALDRDQKA